MNNTQELEEEFEIILTIRCKGSNRTASYNLCQREIDHGHVPRIVKFFKDQLREKVNATN